MEDMLKKWSALSTPWKMYITGGVLVALPIAFEFDLGSASVFSGIYLAVGALVGAMGKTLD